LALDKNNFIVGLSIIKRLIIIIIIIIIYFILFLICLWYFIPWPLEIMKKIIIIIIIIIIIDNINLRIRTTDPTTDTVHARYYYYHFKIINRYFILGAFIIIIFVLQCSGLKVYIRKTILKIAEMT